jgi:hypothetical protein
MKRLLSRLIIAWLIVQGCSYSHAIAGALFPGNKWETTSPAEVGMSEEKLAAARDYALSGKGSGYIVQHPFDAARLVR